MDNVEETAIGVPGRWEDFAREHEKFLRLYPTVTQVLMNELSASSPVLKSQADLVVFYHTCLAVEEFNELILLCGHGYGIGGMKMLRGMYERCVTQRYISKHPNEAETYIAYYHVNMWKMLVEADKVYKGTYKFPVQIRRRIHKDYEALPETVRKMKSWTMKSVPQLALDAGGDLQRGYFNCFHHPTMLSHPTQVGLLSRLDLNVDPPRFKTEMQHESVNVALSGGHTILIQTAHTHNEHFGLNFKDAVDSCCADFFNIWNRKPSYRRAKKKNRPRSTSRTPSGERPA
jgi:hypothetical protein